MHLMGHNGRGKQKRSTRKPGSGRALHDRGDAAEVNRQVGGEELASHSGGAFNKWSEDELESHLRMNLQHVLNEATVRLCDLGYEENDVLNAILNNNGHCYGEKDVLSNVLDNSLRNLINGGKSNDSSPPAFSSLQQLMDIYLGALVYRVQQTMPHLSRRDAMLCVCRMNINPQYPKCFHFMPWSSMNDDLWKRNDVTEVADQGFSANSSNLLQGNSSSSEFTSENEEAPVEQNEVLENAKSQDVMISSLSDIFGDFNLDVPLDEMIIDLVNHIKDLERQVEERKEWAHQRHMQAVKKVGDSRIELDKLTMESKETRRLKTAKLWSMECSLSVTEDTWRESTDQLGRINALGSKLESEYAEMSAQLEASKLSASESARSCAQVAKREKKSSRRLLASEKQKTQLHNDIAAIEQQISELDTQLVQVQAAQKDVQAKQKEAQKAKESALEQLEQERRLLKTTVPKNKREQAASMHQKIEIDIQCHKDEQQRLEQELSRLKMSSQASQLNPHLTNLPMVNTKGTETHGGLTERMFGELDNQEDYSSDRNCFICAEKEVSVVFLPCAHQALCSNCSDSYGKAECPSCGLSIQERIQVFGADSS